MGNLRSFAICRGGYYPPANGNFNIQHIKKRPTHFVSAFLLTLQFLCIWWNAMANYFKQRRGGYHPPVSRREQATRPTTKLFCIDKVDGNMRTTTGRPYVTKTIQKKHLVLGCFSCCVEHNLGIRGAFFCQQNLFFAHTWCVFAYNITSIEYLFAIFIAMVQYYKHCRGPLPDISTKQIFFWLLTASNTVGEDTILPLELHASIFGRLVSPTMSIKCGRIWNPPPT